MSEYEHVPVPGSIQRPDDTTLLVCTTCGCRVNMTDVHTAWHDDLDKKLKEPKDG